MNRKPLPKKIRFRVFQRDNFTCQYCGRSAPKVELHVDHIRSVANGGDNDMDNLITSCVDCNLGKGKLNAVLQKNITVTEEVRPLLRFMTDEEIDDVITVMECYENTLLDVRTLLNAIRELGDWEGWLRSENRKEGLR